MRHKKAKNYRRTMLRLPDLDHSKLAVLNSLTSSSSRRVYQYAIEQFIAWYCSEPRLAFNRIVVVRYRTYLELRGLAANTINQQLAAVRRLAHEAADSGLLSPELAAGIGRVKGVKQIGFRSGNWLTAEQMRGGAGAHVRYMALQSTTDRDLSLTSFLTDSRANSQRRNMRNSQSLPRTPPFGISHIWSRRVCSCAVRKVVAAPVTHWQTLLDFL
jgi:hypothetical protein